MLAKSQCLSQMYTVCGVYIGHAIEMQLVMICYNWLVRSISVSLTVCTLSHSS